MPANMKRNRKGFTSPSLRKIIWLYTGTQARHLPSTPAFSKSFIANSDHST